MMPYTGEISLCMAQQGQRLTSQEAIAAAHHNAKPGSNFTVLREIVADENTRRIGVQALKQARAHRLKLYENGIFAHLLMSGGYLIAETEPQTNKTLAFHLISLGFDGSPMGSVIDCTGDADFGVVNLNDAKILAKDTAEFTETVYSTPLSEITSLESKFYGGHFPVCGTEDCGLFSIPRSLLKLGADQSEYREAAVLYDYLALLFFRYAVSMPMFSANPPATTQAAADKMEKAEAELLRNNHMDPDFDYGLEYISSAEQLRQRIDLFKKLVRLWDEALKNETDPALVKANISIATIPLGVGPYSLDGKTTLYGSGTASLIVIYWQRLSAGVFAINTLSESDVVE